VKKGVGALLAIVGGLLALMIVPAVIFAPLITWFSPDVNGPVCSAYSAGNQPGDPPAPGCDPDAGVVVDSVSLLPGGWALPVPQSARVTSPFGPRNRPCTKYGCGSSYHMGVDLGAPCGTPVHAIHDGKIISITYGTGGDMRGTTGQIIESIGGGWYVGYVHSWGKDNKVKVGDHVVAGQVIMLVGSSGMSTGCHLHFSLKIKGKFVDPQQYLKSVGIHYS